jgi:carboxymethylenebutenolidase
MSSTYCYKGFALPGEPKGTIVGQDYFTAAPNDATQRTKAVILLTDIFGLPLPNPRIVADQLAEQVGVDVWVPDFFNGASVNILYLWWLADIEALLRSGKPPADANTMEPLFPDRAGVKISWPRLMKFILKFIPSIPKLIVSRPSVVDARVHEAGDPSPRALWPCIHEP